MTEQLPSHPEDERDCTEVFASPDLWCPSCQSKFGEVGE